MISMSFFALCLSLSAFPASAEFQRIKTKAVMAEQVVGNKYVNPKGGAWFSFLANGTLAGGYKQQPLTGPGGGNPKWIVFP